MVSFARLSVIQDLRVESDYYYNFTEKELLPIPPPLLARSFRGYF